MSGIIRTARMCIAAARPSAAVHLRQKSDLHMPAQSIQLTEPASDWHEKELSLQEVLALTSAGERVVAAMSKVVDPDVERRVQEAIGLFKMKGRNPIKTYEATHGPRETLLSRSLAMAAIAAKSDAHEDLVVAAFFSNAGYLAADWDVDCPHMAAAIPLYADKWMKKIGLPLHVRYPIRLSKQVPRYLTAKKLNAEPSLSGFGKTLEECVFDRAEWRGMMGIGGPGAAMSAKEVEDFESDFFRDDAMSLARWSEDAAMRQSEYTRQEEDILIQKCEVLTRGLLQYLTFNGNGNEKGNL